MSINSFIDDSGNIVSREELLEFANLVDESWHNTIRKNKPRYIRSCTRSPKRIKIESVVSEEMEPDVCYTCHLSYVSGIKL